MINHTALAWPDGTPYNVISSANGCTLRFSGTVPQFPGQPITNNTYFVFINGSSPAQEVRIVDPVQGITCLNDSTNTNTSLIIKDICPSNAFTPNAPAVSVQQLLDWCAAHNGQTLNYHPQ